jgi:hypothetical protein
MIGAAGDCGRLSRTISRVKTASPAETTKTAAIAKMKRGEEMESGLTFSSKDWDQNFRKKLCF